MGVALEAFAQLISRDDARIDLARACLHDRARTPIPGWTSRATSARSSASRSGCARASPHDAGAEERVIALNEFLFDDLGFWRQHQELLRSAQQLPERGDRPHAPASRSRCRCSTWRSAGASGCRCEGVSFPGHFLVRLQLRGGTLVLDPFAGGAPQSEDELREPAEARDPRRRSRQRFPPPSCRSTSSSSRRPTARSWRGCCAT